MPIDSRLLADIQDEARNLNPGDQLNENVLQAMARYGSDGFTRSVETGCGGSTLLLSNLSRRHVVFAIEGENCIISRVKGSRFLRHETTEFVIGPSQINLPKYRFSEPVDLALIDGPHGFPFPQLEYYYLYPHLRPGSLLILDDIHIRSIHDLFRFLAADSMFTLEDQIGTTAIFRRTSASVFDPHGDGWWTQGYNRHRLFRFTWKENLKRRLPFPIRAGMRKLRGLQHSFRTGTSISIETPLANSAVGTSELTKGRATLPNGGSLWLFVRRADLDSWWPQGGISITEKNQQWELLCRFGEKGDQGHEFEIAAISVNPATDTRLREWMEHCARAGEYPPVQLPSEASEGTVAFRRVKRF